MKRTSDLFHAEYAAFPVEDEQRYGRFKRGTVGGGS